MNEHQIKAREIVIKMQFQPNSLAFEQARMCALIAVNEILDAIDWHNFEFPNKEFIYWQEVKREIEKL